MEDGEREEEHMNMLSFKFFILRRAPI